MSTLKIICDGIILVSVMLLAYNCNQLSGQLKAFERQEKERDKQKLIFSLLGVKGGKLS